MFCSPDISKTLMVIYMAELHVFRNNAWCLKSLCYKASAVISQILLSVTSEELNDRCWKCKSLAKAFCYLVLNPDVTYQPGLPGSSVHSSTEEMQTEPSWPYWITSEVSLSSRCLILTIFIYLQLQWLEQAPLVWLGKVWEVQREYCPFTGIKISMSCAGTQARCRVCSHVTTQQHLLFGAYLNTKELSLWKEWASIVK